ncbi:MAG: energy transducer TonB [Acidobacteriia bacterium]|nr:energy transducer TonB [Terriglobia bacterium]
MRRVFAIRAVILLFSCFSIAQTSPKSVEPQLPCEFKGELFQMKSKPVWFTSDEMKQRATEKVDVSKLLKNVDVNATVIASIIVGVDGRVECLSIINPKHPLVVGEVDKALRKWKFKPVEQRGRPVPYVGWLQFQFCRIGCPEGKSSVTLLE